MNRIIFLTTIIFFVDLHYSYSLIDTTYVSKEETSDTCNKSNGYLIEGIYPQPFGYIARYKFDVPDSSNVKIFVMNTSLDTLIVLFEGTLVKGSYNVEWNRKDRYNNKVKSGIYYLIIEAQLSAVISYARHMYFRGFLTIIVVD